MFRAENGIRLYRFLIIAFLSNFLNFDGKYVDVNRVRIQCIMMKVHSKVEIKLKYFKGSGLHTSIKKKADVNQMNMVHFS